MSEARGGYDRTAGGLIGAMAAALLLIGAMFVLTRIPGGETPDPAPTVDFAAALAQARDNAPFEVLAPEPVPPGWRATSVTAEGRVGVYRWHLGFLVDDEYAAVDQSTGPEKDLLTQVTPASAPGDPVQVNGTEWKTYTDGDDDMALVLSADDTVTVVSGTVGTDALIGFAESLQS